MPCCHRVEDDAWPGQARQPKSEPQVSLAADRARRLHRIASRMLGAKSECGPEGNFREALRRNSGTLGRAACDSRRAPEFARIATGSSRTKERIPREEGNRVTIEPPHPPRPLPAVALLLHRCGSARTEFGFGFVV